MNRALFIVAAKTGPELRAGAEDCRKIHQTLSDPKFGGAQEDLSLPPVLECASPSGYMTGLLEFIQRSADADQRIIYFTGHGRVQGGVYNLVFDGKPLSFPGVTGVLGGQGRARTLFILDTCHSGAADLGGLKTSELALDLVGSAILASSRDIQFSHEDEANGSLFTHYLCECITSGNGGMPTADGVITLPDAAEYIKRKIASSGQVAQNPIYTIKSGEGHLWIARNISGPTTKATQPSRPSDDVLNEVCSDASFVDFDHDLLQAYVRDAGRLDLESIEAIAEAYDLSPPGQTGFPSKAAILCFGKKPSRFFPDVASAFSSGDLTADTFPRSHVDGPLLGQLSQLLTLTAQALRTVATFESDGRRTDRPEIPLTVLREVIANALAHRDFDSKGRVQVRVDPDYVVVSNPGRPPGQHTWEGLLDNPGFSRTNNRRVANLLQAVGGAEGIGRGFAVLKAFRDQNGEGSVVFHQDGEIVVCKLRRPVMEAPPAATAEQEFNEQLLLATERQADALAHTRDFLRPDQDTPGEDSDGVSTQAYSRVLEELLSASAIPGSVTVVLGEPGVGKTHLLRNLFKALARAPAAVGAGSGNAGSERRSLPLFASLRTLNPDLPLLAAVGASTALGPDLIKYMVEHYRPVLLLDGLDECDPSIRQSLLRSIRRAREENPQLCVVLTSRPVEGLSLVEDERTLHLERLTAGDVEKFIKAEAAPDVAAQVKKFIAGPGLDLVSNPLFLRLLIFLFQRQSDAPRTIDQMLSAAAEVLWRRHDSSKAQYVRHRRSRLDGELETFLMEWLATFILAGSNHYVTIDRAHRLLAEVIRQQGSHNRDADLLARDVLDDMAETGFVTIVDQQVSFTHRAFLEHFALRGLTRTMSSPKEIARLASLFITRGIEVDRVADALGEWPLLVAEHELLREEMAGIDLAAEGRRAEWARLGARISSIAEARRLQENTLTDLFGD